MTPVGNADDNERLTPEQHYFNYAVGQVLARHEKVNSRLKDFAVLRERFRHRPVHAKHQVCFYACCQLVQLKMIANPGLLHAPSAIPLYY